MRKRKKWWNGHRKISNFLIKDEEAKLKQKKGIINGQLIKKNDKIAKKMDICWENSKPLPVPPVPVTGTGTSSAGWVWSATAPAPAP